MSKISDRGISGKKGPRYRRKETGHPPDDFSSSLQEDRSLTAEIGLRLAHDDKSAITLAFKKAESNPVAYRYIFKFLQERIALRDVNLDRFEERLAPDLIRNRIRGHISDESLDQWLGASLNPARQLAFPAAVDEIRRCVGGLRLAMSVLRQETPYFFFRRSIDSKKVKAQELASLLEGSHAQPGVAAAIVYHFICAIRDKGRKPVWRAFFEGFSAKAAFPPVPGAPLKVEWNSAAMLRVLIEENQWQLARYYEEFIRTYLRTQMCSNDAHIGDWQRQYDQHFQMLINIQSGTFSSNAQYTYGSQPGPADHEGSEDQRGIERA